MLEMVYHLQLNVAMGPELRFVGVTLNVLSADHWFGAGFVVITGVGLFELCRRQYLREWGEIQEQIEKDIKRREML